MSSLINIMEYPVRNVITILLEDKSTGKNIIWATDAYEMHGLGFMDKDQITTNLFSHNNDLLQPRIRKSIEEQQDRTRKKAEVMTPVWLCNKMNNFADEQWFGRKNVFNEELEDNTWSVTKEKIQFEGKKTWQSYVDSRRLEITCGEAPYLVSRYDTTTGELIEPLSRRIGILDRKLRVVNENASDKEEWIEWAERAVQSCYGYEYQGDSLLIARINILLTYVEYYRDRWGEDPEEKRLKSIANNIAWNIWQMDGLKDTVPTGKLNDDNHQMTMFELLGIKGEDAEDIPCKIYNWRSKKSMYFRDCKEK